MGSDPRVLIVAGSDDLIGPLCRGLDASGWRTVTARSAATAAVALADFALEGAIVVASGLAPHDLTDLLARLRDAAAPRRLPVILIAPEPVPAEVEAAADLVMSAPPHPAQAALRIEHLARAAVAEEEFVLRRDSFAALGAALPAPDPVSGERLAILAAGAPDRRFLALSNALEAAGAEVVAAPTPYTAFDYLHERAFDAAVLWGAEDHAPALSIAAGMKRNTRLYHIPLSLYLRGDGEINLGELYHRGFADVAAADTPEAETAARLLGLARAHRRQLAIRRALEAARASGLTDAATGLFPAEVFAAHLARVIEGARSRGRPLSVCVLKVGDAAAVARARDGGWLDRAMPQIGAMVSRLVRVEDTAARLSPEVFALALPATRAAEARLAAERIAAVIGCTAFDAGPDQSPFVVEFAVGVAEMGPDHRAALLLERALDDLNARQPA